MMSQGITLRALTGSKTWRIDMEINQSQLLQAVPFLYKPRLDEFVASFNMWAIHFGINTPMRMAHYLAQVFHESGSLRYAEEIASGAKYEGRKDLGNIMPGDGVKYKGRGFIQLTGRANYTAFKKSEFCTADVVANPKKVAEFPLNQVASMWFWQTHKCNEWADRDNVDRVTRIINGGTNGLTQRKALLAKFKKVLGVK